MVVVPKVESEKLIEHSIYETYVGKLKDSIDNVGDHSLGVKDITSSLGTSTSVEREQKYLKRNP